MFVDFLKGFIEMQQHIKINTISFGALIPRFAHHARVPTIRSNKFYLENLSMILYSLHLRNKQRNKFTLVSGIYFMFIQAETL